MIICPNGFGSTNKHVTANCNDVTFIAIQIQKALMNFMFDDCTSECIFDSDWPLLLNFKWNSANCWDMFLSDGCEKDYPEVAEKMFARADDFCANMSLPTPLPTVPPTEREICTDDDITDGTHVLLSIDSAYEVLSDICAQIGNQTAKLDGGYIYGDTCEASKTEDDLSYDVMYCATAGDYCDFGDVLLSPDFSVDAESTLVLVKLFDMLVGNWGINNWGVQVTITNSMSVNAVGLYLNSLAENEDI